jgi:hypothetical protein
MHLFCLYIFNREVRHHLGKTSPHIISTRGTKLTLGQFEIFAQLFQSVVVPCGSECLDRAGTFLLAALFLLQLAYSLSTCSSLQGVCLHYHEWSRPRPARNDNDDRKVSAKILRTGTADIHCKLSYNL